MSSASSALNNLGPTVGKFRTIAVMTLPETISGSSHPIVLAMGVERHPHGILENKLGFMQPLGAGRNHVLPAEFIEQRRAHRADQSCCRRGADNKDGQREMLEKVDEFGHTPRGANKVFGEEPSHALARPYIEKEVDQDKRQQEIRYGPAEEADKHANIIADRILVRGRVDADGDCQKIGEEQGDYGDRDRESNAITDDLGHGLLVRE